MEGKGGRMGGRQGEGLVGLWMVGPEKGEGQVRRRTGEDTE